MPEFISESDLQSIYQKLQELQQKVNQLEQRHQTTIVAGGRSNVQPQPLTIGWKELVNIYNYAPQILLAYVTPVAVTAETYRQQNPQEVVLEYSANGYYWVVLTETDAGKSYWLFPHGGRRINFDRLRHHLELLFDLQGDSYLNINFSLEKPAQLRILPSGTSWQLVTKGYIISGKTSPAQKILAEIENIRDSQGKIPTSLNSLLEALQQHHNLNRDINEEIEKLKGDTEKLKDSLAKVVDKLIEQKSSFDERVEKLQGFLEQKIREGLDRAEKSIQLLSSNQEIALTGITRQSSELENKIMQLDYQLAAKLQQQDKLIQSLKKGLQGLFFLIMFLLAVMLAVGVAILLGG